MTDRRGAHRVWCAMAPIAQVGDLVCGVSGRLQNSTRSSAEEAPAEEVRRLVAAMDHVPRDPWLGLVLVRPIEARKIPAPDPALARMGSVFRASTAP
jgi:hypothetical protein